MIRVTVAPLLVRGVQTMRSTILRSDGCEAVVSQRSSSMLSFEDAAKVLADEQGDRFHIEEYDDVHTACLLKFASAFPASHSNRS